MHRTASFPLRLLLPVVAAFLVLSPSLAAADPQLRTQMDLRGDFTLVGATLAQECAAGVPAPQVGTIGECPDSNLLAPDVFWRADDPEMGQARADASFTQDDARATVVLSLPDGASVAYARLYWGGLRAIDMPDTELLLERPDTGLMETVSADDSISLAQNGTTFFFYQATADVTDLVAAEGSGPYRVSDVASDLTNAATGAVAAWYMVVFYELDGAPSRNLAIFDSLEYVDSANQSDVSLSGFVVPDMGFDAKLGVVAFEGEDQFAGDALSFNGMALSNASNPADNFFNATRSHLGSPVSSEGDLPRLSGAARSYSNVDLDVMDVTSRVSGGDTSATIAASSTLDIYVLSAFVTSISTLVPDFTQTAKEVVDLNGGVAAPGDVLEYRIALINQGSDTAVDVTLDDEIPEGVTFVPGSLRIEEGPGAGDKTDASGDDQAEYDEASRTVRVRVGSGADATTGGALAIGEGSEVRFQVTVDDDTRGEVANQGIVTAAGEQGAAEAETPTDADATEDGQTPTTITVEECEDDSHCEAPTPYCDISASPRECVGCANSGHCEDPRTPDCDTETNTCVCDTGPGTCHDSDDDGISDGGEEEIGTDPNDADTDDDGVLDGDETGPDRDNDGDGTINALDPDSDDDGLPDGTELGQSCDHPDTDVSKGLCTPDGDMGATTTNPYDPDTDRGGVPDGDEDANRNGVIDDGETDPNDPTDDNRECEVDEDCEGSGLVCNEAGMCVPECEVDSDCGGMNSGMICENGMCTPGCRGEQGNGCPEDQVCTSMGPEAGMCEDYVEFGGGGCQCGVSGMDAKGTWGALLVALAALVVRRRRRGITRCRPVRSRR